MSIVVKHIGSESPLNTPQPAPWSDVDIFLADQAQLKQSVNPRHPCYCPTCNALAEAVTEKSWQGARSFHAHPCGHRWGQHPNGKIWKGKGQ